MVQLKTDWVDGDYVCAKTTADDDGFNGITNTINNNIIYKYTYDSAAAVSETSGVFTDTAKTFDLSAPVNSYIVGINVKAVTYCDGATTVQSRIKITGTNLGTKYMSCNYLYYESTNYGYYPAITDSGAYPLFSSHNTTEVEQSARLSYCFEVLDATTTFTVQLKETGTGTGHIKDVIIEVFYQKSITDA
jgi:hypothetical protein